MIISGGLVAAGIFGGDSSTPETTTAVDRNGAIAPWSTGALNPPPAAPLDHSAGDDSNSPGFASLLPSPTPTATNASGGVSSQANQTAPTPPPTNAPSSSNANSAASPTATKKPAGSAAAPAATKPPAAPTTAPPTVASTATTGPTLAPTTPPAPTATQAAPTATKPPAPTPTKTPVPPTATATTPPPPPQSVSLDSMEAAMFAAHNAVRGQVGASALSIDAQLVNVARQRSQTMANTNCFSHTACGPTAFDLLGGIGYFYQIAGENIARNNYPDSQTVDVAMNGFINSQGHYNNIVHTSYTKVGVGVAFGANGMKYFTVIFAGP